MPLSGREVLLVLRARDEATRTISRVSSMMKKLDRDALVSHNNAIRQGEDNLRIIQRNMRLAGEAYQDEIEQIHRRHLAGEYAGRQREEAMLAARMAHSEEISMLRQQRDATEDVIRSNRRYIQDLNDAAVLRKDAAHQMIGWGSGLVAAGAGMVYFGAVGVRALSDITVAAAEYDAQARRTLTQTDSVTASLRKVSEAGLDIASTVPVAFEEIQPAMYDVFSSIDVNMREARKLTKQFAKDAVGGATSVAVATRANLQIMNAYKLGVEDVTEVSDFMFQLVRKGVGTYEEFATTIGRSIPSAARAGQSYRTLGAMIAFMTRNGLSAAMASTSAARALDAISHPKTVDKMQKMGITVKNMRGEFLPLPKILDQLNDKFGDLTAPERAKRLYELFKSSGGTIQARRFFDMYFKNADEFIKRQREMQNATDASREAFEKMATSPQAKIQQFKNDWQSLRVELGNAFMPIALRVIDLFGKLVGWFRQLDPETQKMIVKVGAIVTAVLILSGALTALVGGLMIFKGALMLVGSSMSAAVGKAALLTAALVLVTDGIVKLTQGASTGERALGGLELAAAGAAAGFAVGGPLGAAIGGVAGLFGALVIDSQRAQTSVEEAAAAANASMTDWEGLAGTLDQTTGAMTELTRSYIAQNLVETGTSDALASYGIDLRTATLAVEGNKAAIAKVNDALKINQVEVRNARNEWKQKQSAVDDATAAVQNSRDAHARVSQSLYDEAEAAKKTYLQQRNNRDAIKASIGALKSSQKQIRDNASELGHWGKALKELPKEKRTQIKLENIPKSKQEIAELINKFDIARKDIKPLMKAAGFETTKKNVEDVIKKAKALNDSDPTVKIDGDAKRALGVLSSLRTVVDNLTGKTYYIRVVTVHSTQGGGGAGGGGGGGGGKDIQNEWERSLLRRATVEVAGVGRFIAQAMAAFPEQISGPASSAMEEAFSTIDQFIENHTNQQLRKAKRAYEQRYKEQREALKRGWDGSKKDLAKKLAEMEREHDKHVTQLEKRYAKMIKNRIKGLADEKKAVREAAEAYDTTAAALDEWNRKLEDHIRTVHDSFVEYGNVTQLGKSMDIWGQEQAVTWQSIVSDLGQRVLEAQRFQELLVTLAEAGLNPTTLQQIVNAGVEGGLAYAEAIASGGSEAVNQINTLAQQMADAGTAAGVETGVSIYGSTIISLMEQLEKDKGQLIKAMQRLGRRAGRAIKEGVVAQAGPINTAIGDLAEQWEETLRRKWGLPITGTVPRNATAPTAPSATTTNNYQYVTVYTQEIDPAANAVSLSWELANRTG